MKTFIACFICLLYLPGLAQKSDKKKKEINDKFSTCIYTIDKKSKLKEGEYVRIRNSNQDTLATGQYENDRKIGIWKYRNSHNKDYITYNYDSGTAEYLDPSISKVDSFLTVEESNGLFFLNKVDSPPVYLGFAGEVKIVLDRNINVPPEEMAQGIKGSTAASFVISRTGKISDIMIERSLNRSMDRIVLNAIKLLDSEWIPAKIKNVPTDAKMNILVYISNSKILSPKGNQYEIVITRSYFGMPYIRTETRTIEVPNHQMSPGVF